MALDRAYNPSPTTPPPDDSPQKSGDSYTEEKTSESQEISQAVQFNRTQNIARNNARKSARGNPNERDRLEIEALKNEVESSDNIDSLSTSVTRNGLDGIDIALKFDVPLGEASTERLTTRKSPREKFSSDAPRSRPQTSASPEKSSPETTNTEQSSNENTPDNPLTSNAVDSSNSSDTPENIDTETETARSNNDWGEMAEAQKKQIDGQISNSPEQKTLQQEEAQQQKQAEDQKLEQDVAIEQERKQEDNARIQTQQKNVQEQGLQAAKAQMTQQMREAQNQATMVAKAQQKKQKLATKIRNLRLKKLPLTALLRAMQLTRFSLWVAHLLLQIPIFICTLLSWTIILGIVGLILKGIDWALTFLLKIVGELIDQLKKQIKAIDADIDETTKNQQQLQNVIQSMQRKRRTGRARQTQKFAPPPQA
jgi:hypothetical protein